MEEFDPEAESKKLDESIAALDEVDKSRLLNIFALLTEQMEKLAQFKRNPISPADFALNASIGRDCYEPTYKILQMENVWVDSLGENEEPVPYALEVLEDCVRTRHELSYALRSQGKLEISRMREEER